jgi:hypothetical protein
VLETQLVTHLDRETEVAERPVDRFLIQHAVALP